MNKTEVENNQKSFTDIREEYVEYRGTQRQEIVKYFQNGEHKIVKSTENLTVHARGGQGGETYTSRGGIAPYNLSIWKWVECWDEDNYYFISLQAFDWDSETGNNHVLFDRIGVYAGKNQPIAEKRVSTRMTITDIDLPLDETKFERLSGWLYWKLVWERIRDELGANGFILPNESKDKDYRETVYAYPAHPEKQEKGPWVYEIKVEGKQIYKISLQFGLNQDIHCAEVSVRAGNKPVCVIGLIELQQGDDPEKYIKKVIDLLKI